MCGCVWVCVGVWVRGCVYKRALPMRACRRVYLWACVCGSARVRAGARVCTGERVCRGARVCGCTCVRQCVYVRERVCVCGAFARERVCAVRSIGCVLSELKTGTPLFRASSAIATLFQIFQLLGTPTDELWPEMTTHPHWQPHVILYSPLQRVSRACAAEPNGEASVLPATAACAWAYPSSACRHRSSYRMLRKVVV